MPLIKINRIVLTSLCGTTAYNISHTVTGSLSFSTSTDIFIDNDTYQGPGVYTLFTGFSSVSGVNNLNIVGQSICSEVMVTGNSITVTLN